MKMKVTKPLMLFTAVLLVSGGLVAYAATTLFTQSIPSQTFPPPSTSPYLSAGSCGGSLVLAPAFSNVPKNEGASGALVYACSISEAAAFTTSGGPAVATTPTFTLPSGWTLSVDTPSDPISCTFTTSLTSGTPLTLPTGTSFYYCLTTTSASNFTSFSITWSQ